MDVAKYIGLFLLKNEQCYVHGLGTLQLIRKAATYDGLYLQAPSHEIVMVPGGNVDESLANYIATNEQISITKASNALKDFSAETRSMLQAGSQVSLPFLGKFTLEDNRIGFITAPQLQYKAAPIAAKKGVSMQHNERPPIPHQPYIPSTPIGSPMAAAMAGPAMQASPQPNMAHHHHRKERLNWARIIFVLLLLVVMAGGSYYAYMRYMAPHAKTPSATLTIPDMDEEPVPAKEIPADTNMVMPADTTGQMRDTALPGSQAAIPPVQQQAAPANQLPAKPKEREMVSKTPATQVPPPVAATQKQRSLQIVIYTTDSKDKAYQLKRNAETRGNKVEVKEEDANYYMVLVNIKTATTDDKRVEDSISRVYNVEEAFVY